MSRSDNSTSGTGRQNPVPDDGPELTPPAPGPSSPLDGGVGAPPGPHDPDAATSSPTPPSPLDDLIDEDLITLREWYSRSDRVSTPIRLRVDPPVGEGRPRGRYMDAEEAAECFRTIVGDTDPVRRAMALSSLAATAGYAVVSPPAVVHLAAVLRALRERVLIEEA